MMKIIYMYVQNTLCGMTESPETRILNSTVSFLYLKREVSSLFLTSKPPNLLRPNIF